MKNKEFKNIMFLVVIIAITGLFVFGTNNDSLQSALAFLNNKSTFYMEDITNGVNQNEEKYTNDEDGINNQAYKFKVINNSNKDINYVIKFNNNKDKVKELGYESLNNKYLRYAIRLEDNEYSTPTNLNNEGMVLKTTIKAKSEQIYDFVTWLDSNADENAQEKMFIGKISVEKVK